MTPQALPHPKLKLVKNTGEERAVFIEKPKFTIGRSGENDVQTNDASVSRFHAEILKNGTEYTIVDKQSKCGTFVNGQRIESAILKHQDRILLGNDTQILFLTQEETSKDSAPFITDTPSMILSVAGSDLKNGFPDQFFQ
jgi:pSer/pThr/pTyr-binding forkhead associated (FHA) protein